MIKYYIDNIDLATKGIIVSNVKGLFNLPKLKDTLSVNYPSRNGIIVDLSKPIYDVRDIELSCYVKATSRLQFLTLTNELITQLFAKSNLRELRIDYESQKPLFYFVYLKDGLDIEHQAKWNYSNHIGQFSLKLIEPEPLKRVYIFNADNVLNARQLGFLYQEPTQQFTIYWGDGNFDVIRAGTSVSHVYAVDGIYYVSFVGMVNEIQGLVATETLETLWNLL